MSEREKDERVSDSNAVVEIVTTSGDEREIERDLERQRERALPHQWRERERERQTVSIYSFSSPHLSISSNSYAYETKSSPLGLVSLSLARRISERCPCVRA
jgi:hypothetical protein